jgi:acetoin utilization deacetylase AcuC-like enzyme
MKRREALRMLGLGAAMGPLAGVSGMGEARAAASPPSRRVGVCYSPAYVGAAHAFETTRKSAWVAESLAQRPIPGIELVGNLPLAPALLARAHAPAYIQAVRTGRPRALAESQGFAWDPQLWTMVLASNGGVVKAAAQARLHGVAGALSSGLHHARRDRGNGFCTFNGLAIAALEALERGARRVLVLDLDAHCGGGTHSILGTHPGVHQLDLAVDEFDLYRPAGGNTLDLVRDAADYLPTLDLRLRALRGQAFDLCLYNAGMDPHQHSPVGGLRGIDAGLLAKREQRVFSWCAQQRLPIAFVLAGGYIGPALDRAGLVALHRLTLAAAALAATHWPAQKSA